VVLIFQVSVVVVLLALLAPVIVTFPICTPVAAAGVTNAGTPAPPLNDVFNAPPALPEPAAAALTALAGILSPASRQPPRWAPRPTPLPWCGPALKPRRLGSCWSCCPHWLRCSEQV